MIETYSDYIKRYILATGLGTLKAPGEHHFVSTYLTPKLFAHNKRVPDYINPDGTKRVIGDVTYYKDGKHELGIEVKLGTIRLTSGEFNKWIVDQDESLWPHIFIGVATAGLGVATWGTFREKYIEAVRKFEKNWSPTHIPKGYGPTRSVNLVIADFGNEGFFPFTTDAKTATANEEKFMCALAQKLNGN